MGENLEAQAPSLPARVVGLADARRTFGRSVDRLMPALHRSDPLADDAVRVLAEQQQSVHATLDRALSGDRAVPDAVRRLIDAAAELPVWADEHRLDRAGELLFRASVPGGIALGAKSLLSGYCSPAGNKPLIWSGQLMRGISRRLGETAKFVCAVAAPGGLNPGAEGFQITLRVRLIHAQVRRLIEAQGGWRADLWGLPINQHDMAATILLFGNAWLDGIEALGISVTAEEAEDYVHLWRVAGHIIGVEHDLLPATRSEGDRLAKIIQATEGEPDDDARRLVKAFLTHPLEQLETAKERRDAERRMQAYAGCIRGLLGEKLADQLELPKDRWRFMVPALREVVRRAERLRRTVPGGRRLAIQSGRRHWQNVIELGLMGLPAEFNLPSQLGLFNRDAA